MRGVMQAGSAEKNRPYIWRCSHSELFSIRVAI